MALQHALERFETFITETLDSRGDTKLAEFSQNVHGVSKPIADRIKAIFADRDNDPATKISARRILGLAMLRPEQPRDGRSEHSARQFIATENGSAAYNAINDQAAYEVMANGLFNATELHDWLHQNEPALETRLFDLLKTREIPVALLAYLRIPENRRLFADVDRDHFAIDSTSAIEIAAIDADIASNKQRIGELQAQIRGINPSIPDAEKTIAAFQGQIQVLRDAIADLKQERAEKEDAGTTGKEKPGDNPAASIIYMCELQRHARPADEERRDSAVTSCVILADVQDTLDAKRSVKGGVNFRHAVHYANNLRAGAAAIIGSGTLGEGIRAGSDLLDALGNPSESLLKVMNGDPMLNLLKKVNSPEDVIKLAENPKTKFEYNDIPVAIGQLKHAVHKRIQSYPLDLEKARFLIRNLEAAYFSMSVDSTAGKSRLNAEGVSKLWGVISEALTKGHEGAEAARNEHAAAKAKNKAEKASGGGSFLERAAASAVGGGILKMFSGGGRKK